MSTHASVINATTTSRAPQARLTTKKDPLSHSIHHGRKRDQRSLAAFVTENPISPHCHCWCLQPWPLMTSTIFIKDCLSWWSFTETMTVSLSQKWPPHSTHLVSSQVKVFPFKISPYNLEEVIAPCDTQISMQDYKTIKSRKHDTTKTKQNSNFPSTNPK